MRLHYHFSHIEVSRAPIALTPAFGHDVLPLE